MSPSYRIVFYVSGHGFGHSSRIREVIRALQDRDPAASTMVKTSAPRRLYEGIHTEFFRCDTGMVQLDSLHLDTAESLQQAAAFHATLGGRAASEAAFLRDTGARIVVGDIPPLAFAAAADAGLPSIAIGNFTWDWIYEGYGAGDWIGAIRAAYRKATLALRLPMSGGFAGLEPITRDIPFVARHSKREAADVRRWLDVPEGKTLLLMSFGGYGVGGLDTAALAALRDHAVVTTDFPTQANSIRPAPGLMYVSEQRLYDDGYRYEDLVRAADVVVTKPGYGIISECIANDTAILYTSRGDFREYDILVREMPKYLRAQFIGQEDLLAGRWAPPLEKLLSSPKPARTPDTNGAQAAVDAILAVS
jgi:UDP:flavonoid glycosyltransferase YjiC (YdhE family)